MMGFEFLLGIPWPKQMRMTPFVLPVVIRQLWKMSTVE